MVGIIDIRGDDLLISGREVLIEYIAKSAKEKCEADSYEGNKATYLGTKIEKRSKQIPNA